MSSTRQALEGPSIELIANAKQSTAHATACSTPPTTQHSLRRLIGPGIMFATAAIGVSHLVQCTRSGAVYGWQNTWAIAAALVFKYPFFEFSTRYANVTGKSLVDGYRELGRPVVLCCLVITAITCPVVCAAIGAVTAAFLDNLLSIPAGCCSFLPEATAAALLGATVSLLTIGRFSLLDALVKAITALLVVCTLAAVAAAVTTSAKSTVETSLVRVEENAWSPQGVRFLVALMGWMPIPVDTGSIMGSLWTVERFEASGYHPPLRHSLAEFNAGYLLTTALAFAFLSLAALLLHGAAEPLPSDSAALAAAVVSLYADALGAWAQPVVGVASACAMLGTCLTTFDGYARTLSRALQVWQEWPFSPRLHRLLYCTALVYIALSAFALLALLSNGLSHVVDLATTVSFVLAPAVGAVNTRLVTRAAFPRRPPLALQLLAFAGLIFLMAFCGMYLSTLVP